jgi:DNA-binding NarL/FixJ family response regulator
MNDGVTSTRITAVIQQRCRLVREGLADLLGLQADIVVAGTAVTGADLVMRCAETAPAAAILELDDPAEDASRTAAVLCHQHPGIRFVALYRAASHPSVARADAAGFPVLVDRSAGVDAVGDALRAAMELPATPIVAPEKAERTIVLDAREVHVLELVGAGCTTREISDRLAISRKTVENHKHRIFTKLHVQNQAHAVAVAMRAGIITADGVLDLTDPD